MEISKVWEMQKGLDDKIHEDKGLTREETFEKRVLALCTELGELANEWRGFKYWSDRQKPRIVRKGVKDKDAEYFRCGLMTTCGATRNEYSRKCPECGEGDMFGEKRVYPLKEEYVDNLHFIISLGQDLGVDKVAYRKIENDKSITRQFIELQNMATMLVIHQKEKAQALWHDLFSAYVRLGEDLGFTWDEVKDAYFEKNKVNHERLESGY